MLAMALVQFGIPEKFTGALTTIRHAVETSGIRKRFLTYAPTPNTSTALAPVSPMPRLRKVALVGNLLICTFIVGFGTWSVFAPLKSAAIASGVVEPELSRKTIQHFEGGIVRQILVKNGDAVKAGQTLI